MTGNLSQETCHKIRTEIHEDGKVFYLAQGYESSYLILFSKWDNIACEIR